MRTFVPSSRFAVSITSLVVLMSLSLLTAACGSGGEPSLDVGRAQAGLPVAGTSQIIVEISNTGDGDDTFLGAETDAALGIELHRTEITDGRASMSELQEVEIPAGETVRFRPGGLHLMMVVPDETVTVGTSFDMTLRFDHSGELTVPVEVVELLDLVDDASADGQDDESHDGHADDQDDA